jgi:Asp-tRNA(Asn)/Glu-tRNA(Gln) amidotransferase A subunit family amidase
MARTVAAVAALEEKGQVVFSHVDATVASQAAASTARFAAGAPLSVLDGVPVAFKDMVDVAGAPICNGQARDSGNCVVSETDDPAVVARFREMGAIVFGITVMPEGGVTPLGYSAHWQGPVNAFSSQHYSGGSSSGSGVAVAANLVPLAIGYDGGGSVRIPASASGKYTHGTHDTHKLLSY